MAGSTKARTTFGFHQATFINRATGVPYGTTKIVVSAEANNERESIDLRGGSNPNVWDSEMGNLTNDLSLTVREFNPFLFELAGWARTNNAAESGGSATTSNLIGTTVDNATTGVVVSIGTATDLKDGIYRVVADTANTISIYALSDAAFGLGTDAQYSNDTLALASGLTVANGAVVTLTGTQAANIGLVFTGGTGVALNAGDVMEIEVRAVNLGSNTYEYGENPVPPEFELLLASNIKTNGEYTQIIIPRAKLGSLPTSLTEKEWSESAIPIKILYDESRKISTKRIDIIKEQ